MPVPREIKFLEQNAQKMSFNWSKSPIWVGYNLTRVDKRDLIRDDFVQLGGKPATSWLNTEIWTDQQKSDLWSVRAKNIIRSGKWDNILYGT